MKVVATYNVKGGVGKTSAAVNLADCAARSGLRTLLWDLDPQGAATFLLRVKPRVRGGAEKLVTGRSDAARSLKATDVEGLDLLPADFSNRHMDVALSEAKKPTRRLGRVLAGLADGYDVALLDCPPSISMVSENVFDAADALVVPLIPSTLSLSAYHQLLGFMADSVKRVPDVIAFFSMVDGRKRLHRETVEMLHAEDVGVARTVIPSRSDVEQMGVHRAPLSAFAPRGDAARAYADLWAEVAARVGV